MWHNLKQTSRPHPSFMFGLTANTPGWGNVLFVAADWALNIPGAYWMYIGLHWTLLNSNNLYWNNVVKTSRIRDSEPREWYLRINVDFSIMKFGIIFFSTFGRSQIETNFLDVSQLKFDVKSEAFVSFATRPWNIETTLERLQLRKFYEFDQYKNKATIGYDTLRYDALCALLPKLLTNVTNFIYYTYIQLVSTRTCVYYSWSQLNTDVPSEKPLFCRFKEIP